MWYGRWVWAHTDKVLRSTVSLYEKVIPLNRSFNYTSKTLSSLYHLLISPIEKRKQTSGTKLWLAKLSTYTLLTLSCFHCIRFKVIFWFHWVMMVFLLQLWYNIYFNTTCFIRNRTLNNVWNKEWYQRHAGVRTVLRQYMSGSLAATVRVERALALGPKRWL